MSKREPPEKPLSKEVVPFVIFHLHDRSAFAPLTGTDWDAWKAFLYLVRLWGRTRSQSVVDAMRSVVASAQTRNADVMAVFKKSIPCLLDWSDEPTLWRQIGPDAHLSDTDQNLAACIAPAGMTIRRVMVPCADGPRVCHHENSRPYKHAVPEPGYTLDKQCRDCGAIWREKFAAIKGAP